MAKKKGADLGQPRTGDGWTSGAKPRTEHLRVLDRNGVPTSTQPPGWVGKVTKLHRNCE